MTRARGVCAQNADDLEPVQEWTLPERAGNDSNLQYPTNFARFQNVQTLVMYFPTNHGADVSEMPQPSAGPPRVLSDSSG